LDDQLRLAIDRLVKDGGRLTVDAADGGTSVVLEQPGSRFGILEVNGRVQLASADLRAVADLAGLGWTDPTVTHRLGREIRLPSADPDPDGPIKLTGTWRVPPSLAAEIADAVRVALGEIGRVDFLPITTRGASSVDFVRPPRPPTEELDLDDPETRRSAGRTVPAPLKGLFAVTLLGAVALAWAGMIRGAPRDREVAIEPSVTAVAAAPPSPGSPTADISASPSVPPSGPIRSLAVSASTEDETGPASAAVDGDRVTAWHAAFGVPQWIEIGLDGPTTVTSVELLIAQAENGPTRHMILVAVTGQALQVVGVVDRQTTDGEAIRFAPEAPIENVERIRIETMASPSNAGWYEVIVR
jgi:F5/8 type C domain-containing protein